MSNVVEIKNDHGDVTEESRADMEEELKQVNEDIETLRLALASKVNRSKELMKKLGLSTSFLPFEIPQSIAKIGETEAYAKTTEVLEKAMQKTKDVAFDTKDKVSSTYAAMKNSDTYKTVETKVGSALCTVKEAIVHSTYGHLPEDNDN